MANPFDATPGLARYLHPKVCERDHDFEPSECIFVAAALAQLRDELNEAGVVAVPAATLEYLQRAFSELIEETTPREDIAIGPPGPVRDLYFAHVRLRMTKRDGSIVRTEPMVRWVAELQLSILNFDHEADIAGAIIEPEPAWIARLLDELPGA